MTDVRIVEISDYAARTLTAAIVAAPTPRTVDHAAEEAPCETEPTLDLRLPSEWDATMTDGMRIADADGWAHGPLSWHDRCTHAQFMLRRMHCTLVPAAELEATHTTRSVDHSADAAPCSTEAADALSARLDEYRRGRKGLTLDEARAALGDGAAPCETDTAPNAAALVAALVEKVAKRLLAELDTDRAEWRAAYEDAVDELNGIRAMCVAPLLLIDGGEPHRGTPNLVRQVLDFWAAGEPWPGGEVTDG